MAIPERGENFRDFTIGSFDSARVRSQRPLLLIIWKVGCSTSRMTIPFFDRLQDSYPQAEVVGVAQESEEDLRNYIVQNKLRFRQIADSDLKVTRQFEVEYVPAYWLTDAAGVILEAGSAWEREKMIIIGDALAKMTGVEARSIFREDDLVPDYKPG